MLYDVQTTVNIGDKQVTATILILGCQTGTCETCQINAGGGKSGGGAARVNPQLKALAEGYLAGSQPIMRGSDLITDDAFNAINLQNNQHGWVPFAIMSGQYNRYNSGSHIKSNDFLLTGGPFDYQQDDLTAGAFVEAGWGRKL